MRYLICFSGQVHIIAADRDDSGEEDEHFAPDLTSRPPRMASYTPQTDVLDVSQ